VRLGKLVKRERWTKC